MTIWTHDAGHRDITEQEARKIVTSSQTQSARHQQHLERSVIAGYHAGRYFVVSAPLAMNREMQKWITR